MLVALPLTDQFALPKFAFALFVAGLLICISDAPFTMRRWRRQPLPVVAALALIAVLTLSTAAADYPRASVIGTYADYNGLLYYVPGIVAFCVACAIVRGVGALDRFVSLLAIGALPVLGYALVQLAGADPVTWDIGFGRRVFSTLGQPLVLGGYLAMLLPLLLWLALRRRGGERIFLAAETVLAGAMLIATGTRGAYLGAIAGAVVAVALLFVMRGVTRRQLLAAVSACVIAIAAVATLWVLGAVPARMRSAATLSERADLWRGGAEMAADRPLLGWGPDQFAVAYGPYRHSAERGSQSPYEAPAASPHSEIVMVLVAGGGAALVAYAALWAAVASVAVSIPGGRRRNAGVALAAAMAGYAVQAQFSIPDSSLNLIAMALLGALAGISPPPRLPEAFVLPRISFPRGAILAAPFRLAGAGLAVAAVLLVAADYVHARALVAVDRNEAASIDRMRLAATLNPLQATYLDDVAAAHEASVQWGVPPDAARSSALDRLRERIDHFGAGAATYLDAARVASAAPDTLDLMEGYLDAAARADPKNPGLPAEIEEIRRGASDPSR